MQAFFLFGLITDYQFNYELRIINLITNYELSITNYQLRITQYRLQQ